MSVVVLLLCEGVHSPAGLLRRVQGDYKIQLSTSTPSGDEIVCVGITWDA